MIEGMSPFGLNDFNALKTKTTSNEPSTSFFDVLSKTNDDTNEESITDNAIIRVPIDKILAKDGEYVFITQDAINKNLLEGLQNNNSNNENNVVNNGQVIEEIKSKDVISDNRVDELVMEIMSIISNSLTENTELLENIAQKMGLDKNQLYSAIVTEFKNKVASNINSNINIELNNNKDSNVFSENSKILQYVKQNSKMNIDKEQLTKIFNNSVKTFLDDLNRNASISGKAPLALIKDTMKMTFNNEKTMTNFNEYMNSLKVETKTFNTNNSVNEHSMFLSNGMSKNVKDINVNNVHKEVEKLNSNKVTVDDNLNSFENNTQNNVQKSFNAELGKLEKLPVSEYKDSIVNQVKENITKNSLEGKKEFTMQLKPEGLGKLTIKFTHDVHNKVAVNILTQSEEIKKLLTTEFNTIKSDLKYIGDINVKVEKSDNTDTQHFNSSFNEQFNGRNGYNENFSSNSNKVNNYNNVNGELLDDLENEVNVVEKRKPNSLVDVYI